MFRKMLGTFTAVAAALLLVGVAWASGDDARDDSNSGSSAVSASADVSSSGSLATESTGTSLDDNSTSTSIDDNSSSTSVDDNSSTSISLVDTSSTSTSTIIDSTTSTSVDDNGSTSSTVDDNQNLPITTDPKTYDVNGAGTVSLQVVAGQLVLIDVSAASGWNLELDKADSREIKVEFESGDSDAKFEAKLDHGELRVKIERD